MCIVLKICNKFATLNGVGSPRTRIQDGHSMVVIVSIAIRFGLLNVGTAGIGSSNMAVCIVQYGDWYANSSN